MRYSWPLFLFVALCAAFMWKLGQSNLPTRNATPSMVGQTLAPLALAGLEDTPSAFNSSTLRGQIYLINIFASWCAPCVAEVPVLNALHARFPALPMVGIAWKDTPAAVASWLEKHGKSFTAIGLDPQGSAAVQLGVVGVPETYIIDGEGIIRYHFPGPLTEAELTHTLIPLLEQLYATPQPAGITAPTSAQRPTQDTAP